MATLDFSVLTNLLYENYGALVVEAFTQQGPGNWLIPDQSILGRLRARGRIFVGGSDGNNRYVKEWGIHSATSSAVSYDVNDTYPTASTETYGDASIGWKRIWITSEIDNLVRLAAGRSASRDQLAAWARDQAAKLKALVAAIETQLAGDGTGNSNKNLDGFLAFLSESNTYAGIDQSANSYWRAVVNNASSTAISVSRMQSTVQSLWDNNALGPNMEIWMNLTQFNRWRELFDGKIRYAPGATLGQVGQPVFDDGANSIPIHVIKAVPTSEVWFCNLDSIEVRFLGHTPEDGIEERDQETQYETFPIAIEPINTSNDTKAIAYKTYCNAVCTNPRQNGIITNLTT